MLTVNEIFYSIQGESLFAGLACTFVRLTGCNLRCTYCDTRYAYAEGDRMSVAEVVRRVADHDCRLVEITGGEPLAQRETPDLVDAMVGAGYDVLLETNGSYDISRVNTACIKIVDVKCPSSGECDKNDWGNLTRLGKRDQLKFVVGSRNDYDFAHRVVAELDPSFPRNRILFSPVSGRLAPARLATWILDDGLAVRLHLQLHRIIWPRIQRGV